MARARSKGRKVTRGVRWTWSKVVKPGGKWLGKSVVTPTAKRAGRAAAKGWGTAWSPAKRRDARDRLLIRINGRPKWVGTAGLPADELARRRRWKNSGGFFCVLCGHSEKKGHGDSHACDPRTAHAYQQRKRKQRRKARQSKRRTDPPKPRESKLPPVTNPTKGARIVRAGTAAERFAFLATIDPNELSVGEFERMITDISAGVTQLALELGSLGADLNMDPKVKEQFEKLSTGIADQAETARDIRRVFRRQYRDLIRIAKEMAATKAPPIPNAAFFDDIDEAG
jgi:hypothetical protein